MVVRPSTVTQLRAREAWDRFQNDAAEVAESVARRVVLPRLPPERVNAGLERLKPPRRHRMMPILEEFGRLRRDAYFVQIGANDGEQQDPLRDIVLSREWSGIMVEPVPYVFARLRRNYGHLQRLKLENVAVAPGDGPKTFYHLRDTDDAGRPGLPTWFDALGSFNREVLLAHRHYIPDIDARIVELEVPCVTFDTLCSRNNVERVDFLLTDTEGYDFEILKSVDFKRWRPTLIVYESFHLVPGDKQACIELLAGFDYETFEYGLDTWCFNASTLPVPEAAVLVPLWRWLTDASRPTGQLAGTRALRLGARRVLRRQGGSSAIFGDLFKLTESERRYLHTGYDDSTPLPGGATAYLTPTNARLRELTERYRRLDSSAVSHHGRRPEDVPPIAELVHFRGEKPHTGHYTPEHPRAMAMVLFVYMQYLEGQGGAELLARLPEDGAFGCWTTEVPGRGKLSRDRLDSANEILFLDRQLNLLSRPSAQILEIGAGYGRLAYRMAQADLRLGDYCCVDAAATSTFTSEYYLRFRNVSPPTRVVTLDDVPALEPGSFDVAVVRSFSECTRAAVEWWLTQLTRIRIPHLFVISSDAENSFSREADVARHGLMPSFAAAGYRPTAVEPVIGDPAARELLRIHGNFCLLELVAQDS